MFMILFSFLVLQGHNFFSCGDIQLPITFHSGCLINLLFWHLLLLLVNRRELLNTELSTPNLKRETSYSMFCTKLKDLKITGECPFSLLTQGHITEEHDKDCTENSSRAALPICKEVHEKDGQGDLPQRKTSRSRVYLHTLTESICKLIFPEVNRY